MNPYGVQCTLQPLGESVDLMTFSPNGRFLVVGGREPACLRILDRLVGFRPTIKTDTIPNPTSLAFESQTSFLAGFNDGRFVRYAIDLTSKRLVEGWTNNTLRGVSCVTAIALDETSQTLALATGPSVFVFSRISETGRFQFTANISKYFNFRDGSANPSPKSLCFSSCDQIHVSFSEQLVVSAELVSERYSGLQPFLPFVDYSGFSILRAVRSSDKKSTSGFSQFWIYGEEVVPQVGGDAFPFLLINGGMALLSGSSSGAALIKDVVTRRTIQSLKHDDCTARPLKIAYHAGERYHTIATANPGPGGVIKIWRADNVPRASGRLSCNSNPLFWGCISGLTITVLVAILWNDGFSLDGHQLHGHLANTFLLVSNWICGFGTTAIAYIVANVGGTLKEWYREVGARFLLPIGEHCGGR